MHLLMGQVRDSGMAGPGHLALAALVGTRLILLGMDIKRCEAFLLFLCVMEHRNATEQQILCVSSVAPEGTSLLMVK